MTGARTARARLVAGLRRRATAVRATAHRTGRGVAVVVRRLVPPLAFLALIAWWLAAVLLDGLKAVLDYKGVLGDGPLQLFNPLRRIDAGQRGGADFQFFHGIAIPYLHYPLFVLGGKTIFASELARHGVSAVQAVVGFLAVFAGATRRLTPTLGLTAAALILTYQLSAQGIAEPQHSLIGLRSVAPLFVVGLLLAGVRPNREAMLAGVLAAVGLLIGTEHGVASVVMLGMVWAGRRWAGHPGGARGWPLRAGAAFAVTLAGLLLVIGGPTGAVKAMTYAFRDLPADQFWYFGAPPNTFVVQPVQLADRTLWLWGFGPVLVLVTGIVGVVRANPAARPAGVVLLAALVAGSLGGIGYLGYDSTHYLLPVLRMALVVALAAGWSAVRWYTTDPERARMVVPAGRAAVAALTVMFLFIGPTHWPLAATPQLALETRAAATDYTTGRARLAPHLDTYLRALTGPIDADRAAAGTTRPPVIWSMYAGLLEDHYGVFHPHTDYVIHAIGPRGREDYLAGFRATQPDYVVIFRRDFFSYEEWLQHGTWPFYEELVLNYDVRAVTHECVLWKRRPEPWRSPDPADGRVSREPDSPHGFTVPPVPGVPADAPFVVEVEYCVENPLGRVPIVGGLPRYLLGSTDCRNRTPVSLPPYRTNWTFLVVPTPGKTPTFFAGTFSLVGGGRVTLMKVHVRPVRAGGRERALWDPAAFATTGGT
jgi:hypothetical protein